MRRTTWSLASSTVNVPFCSSTPMMAVRTLASDISLPVVTSAVHVSWSIATLFSEKLRLKFMVDPI